MFPLKDIGRTLSETRTNTLNKTQSITEIALESSLDFEESSGESFIKIHTDSETDIRHQIREDPLKAELDQLLAEADSLERLARRARLKKLRYFRFTTGNSEISRQSKQSALKGKPVKLSKEMNSDSDIDLWLDVGDDDDSGSISETSAGFDTIKAKRNFLKYFEIPSLSDISEDLSDSQAKEVSGSTYKTDSEIDFHFFEEEEDEEEAESFANRPVSGEDTIKAKTDFLKLFAVPSLSDISDDKDNTPSRVLLN